MEEVRCIQWTVCAVVGGRRRGAEGRGDKQNVQSAAPRSCACNRSSLFSFRHAGDRSALDLPELKLDQRMAGRPGAARGAMHAAVCPTFGGWHIDAPVKDVE
jgi:hypothetical protein